MNFKRKDFNRGSIHVVWDDLYWLAYSDLTTMWGTGASRRAALIDYAVSVREEAELRGRGS